MRGRLAPPQVKIEKGIPIPRVSASWAKFFDQINDGDSFLVPNTDDRDRVSMQAKRYGVKVITRKEDGAGYRVWRVKSVKKPL